MYIKVILSELGHSSFVLLGSPEKEKQISNQSTTRESEGICNCPASFPLTSIGIGGNQTADLNFVTKAPACAYHSNPMEAPQEEQRDYNARTAQSLATEEHSKLQEQE